MASSSDKRRLLARAALELAAGDTVNLGIGLPAQVMRYVPDDVPVCLHSENGISGMRHDNQSAPDRNLIDAGGAYVQTAPGGAFFDSAMSFALVRGGRLDLAILGALEVAANGDLANWMIPGRFAPGIGGGMELAQKARRVLVLTTHQDKRGRSKIVERCSLPLTAAGCVSRIITELAVMDINNGELVLREVAAGVGVHAVQAATAATLVVPAGEIPVFGSQGDG